MLLLVCLWIGIELADDREEVRFVRLELVHLQGISLLGLYLLLTIRGWRGVEVTLRGRIEEGDLDELGILFGEWRLEEEGRGLGAAVGEEEGRSGLVGLALALIAQLHLFIN